MKKPVGWNGPAVELQADEDFLERASYCVMCGTIFVWAEGRDCPGCTNAAALKNLNERLDELESKTAWIDQDVQEIFEAEQNEHNWGVRDD